MNKILTVVGARPQFIKLGPVSKQIRKFFDEVIVHTGQHFDDEMSEVFFSQLKIPKPDYNLGVHSKSNAEQVALVLKKIDKVVIEEKPDLIVVYGDTNATLAGATAGRKHDIPIAHIEAGMRSYNDMPEETNRVLTDQISELFFCSTSRAVSNLAKEAILSKVFLVGDVMIDALIENIRIAESESRILDKLMIEPKKYILATIHRAQNTDSKEKLSNVFEAFSESNKDIILPLHPRTKKYIKEYGIKLTNNVKVIEPLSYLDMLVMEKNARKILTDSGGIQKEALFFNVPCITMREVTEWTETVSEGFNILVDTDKVKIIDAINNFEITGKNKDIYGRGDASKKIAEEIRTFLGKV